MVAANLSPRSFGIYCPGSSHSLQRWARWVLLLGVVVTELGTSGCMSARLEEFRNAPTRLRANESVVLLAQPRLDGSSAEASFMDCLHRRLSDAVRRTVAPVSIAVQSLQAGNERASTATSVGAAQLEIFPRRKFVDAFYPWLEPSTAPTTSDALAKFLDRPGVRERVTSLGVRYIVWIDGATLKTDGGGSITCGMFGGGAGCFGVGWWQKKSSYQATVYDLDSSIDAGNVSTSVDGFSVLLGLGIPIPLIAPVQGLACRRLSAQLQAFLHNDTYR